MNEIGFATIVSVAFLSSFTHCIGMCGGFASVRQIYLRDMTSARSVFLSFVYHVSRILAYSLLGACFGAFGAFFNFSLKQKSILFFVVGLFMMFIAFALWQRGEILKFIENDKFSKFIAKLMLKSKSKLQWLNFAIFGFLNGLLPCGLVYYFLAYSVATQSAFMGACVMIVFGVFTIPAFFLLRYLINFISDSNKLVIFKISIAIIALNGIYLTYLGFMANA